MVHGGPEVRGILAVAVVVLATGCAPAEDRQTTDLDVDRAFRAAQDPWAAPAGISFPTGVYGGNDLLREIGGRGARHPGLPGHGAVELEVRAAIAAGWKLVGAECASNRAAVAAVARGTSLDDAMITTLTSDGPEVILTTSVPHHLDGSWPALPAVRLEESCLVGGNAQTPLPDDLPFGPLPGDDAGPSFEDFEPWQRDTISDEERALVDEVLADPLLSAAGVAVSVDYAADYLRTGDNWREALTGDATIASEASSTRESVAEVVKDSGWVLTWARCGDGIATEATVRIPAEGGTVTAHLRSQVPGEVTIFLGLPVPEAPLTYPQVDDVAVLETSQCLGSAPLGTGVVIEGTPVALPSRLHPYLAN